MRYIEGPTNDQAFDEVTEAPLIRKRQDDLMDILVVEYQQDTGFRVTRDDANDLGKLASTNLHTPWDLAIWGGWDKAIFG
jgi:hypothetical protein